MLERIRRTLGGGIEQTGLRDDAAVVSVPGGGSLVVSIDSVVAGVHVDLALCSPSDVGWKALMGAVSDLAAMGARPVGALVAFCVPGGEGDVTIGLTQGVAEASKASGCPIVGGDLSEGGVLTVVVTVMGTVDSGVAVERAGARSGDVLLITGPCGGSAAGLRVLRAALGRHEQGSFQQDAAEQGAVERALATAYRRPVARLAEGEAARLAGAHALIDVSDGLALDLHRLADASGVGFALESIPVADGATLEEALGGGEDYELIVAIDPQDVGTYASRCAAAGLRPPLPIGVTCADPTDRRLGDGELDRLGWQHAVG
jgi:thiamine-monophosphate kinase